jgi:hypothetical protein
MAAAPILTRSDRALGIIVRDDVIPVDDRPGFFTVRDTATGSGESHLATATSCTCRDHLYREGLCKHRRAVITEEYRLDAYAAGWDAYVAAQRPCCPQSVESSEDDPVANAIGEWIQSQLRPAAEVWARHIAAWNAERGQPRCPDCGAALESAVYWIGGRGYQSFLVCSAHVEHRARRV